MNPKVKKSYYLPEEFAFNKPALFGIDLFFWRTQDSIHTQTHLSGCLIVWFIFNTNKI